jgi:hypothetical protein
LEDNMTPEREAEIRARISAEDPIHEVLAALDDARAERDALRWGAIEADIARAEAACDANPTSAEALRARVMADPVAASAYWQHRAERLTRERDEAIKLRDVAIRLSERSVLHAAQHTTRVDRRHDAQEARAWTAEDERDAAIVRAEAAEAREAALREAAARAQEATAFLAFPTTAHALITERERADEALRAVLRDPSPRVAVLLAAKEVAEAFSRGARDEAVYFADNEKVVAIDRYRAAVEAAKGAR